MSVRRLAESLVGLLSVLLLSCTPEAPKSMDSEHVQPTGNVVRTVAVNPGTRFQCLGETYQVAGRTLCAYRTKGTWPLARITCALGSGRLLTIPDRATTDALFATLGTPGRPSHQSLWIGASDTANEGAWRWTDGSAVEGARWAGRQPDNARNREHCAEFRTHAADWNDLPCDAKRHYLCDAAPDRPFQCLGQSIELGDRRFCFYHRALDWAAAADACETHGGRLARVDSVALAVALGAKFGHERWWLGANDREKEGEWRWDDGRLADYGHWADGEPNSRGNEDCASWAAVNGTWIDAPCDQQKGILCEPL